MSSWGDILPEQLGGDILMDQQHPLPRPLTTPLSREQDRPAGAGSESGGFGSREGSAAGGSPTLESFTGSRCDGNWRLCWLWAAYQSVCRARAAPPIVGGSIGATDGTCSAPLRGGAHD